MNLAQANSPSPNNGNLFNKIIAWFGSTLGKIFVSIFVPAVTFIVLWQGYLFLSEANAPQILQVIVAIVWGVGGLRCFTW